jgi:hypothetical protein
MDNLIFEKIWKDENLIELKIKGISEYIQVYQNCYVEDEKLREIGKTISEYTYNYNNECYVEFGRKEGNFTPAFSMKILPAESSGRMKIEVDFEIADNDERKHRACFYIQGELGLLERLGNALQNVAGGESDICTLYSE